MGGVSQEVTKKRECQIQILRCRVMPSKPKIVVSGFTSEVVRLRACLASLFGGSKNLEVAARINLRTKVTTPDTLHDGLL